MLTSAPARDALSDGGEHSNDSCQHMVASAAMSPLERSSSSR